MSRPKEDGKIAYNIRFSVEDHERLKNFQLAESVRLGRVCSLNECILKAILKAATAKVVIAEGQPSGGEP
jgi:hypothetical protein